MQVTIRQETPADYPHVARVVQEAFKNDLHGDHNEHLLVARLRKSPAFIPELSLVALAQGELVGHILLTRISIIGDDQRFESLALAPVSVLPAFQKKGIGTKLIEASHRNARNQGFKSVILIGHESYYPRFGYEPASKHGITFPFPAPAENCLALELVKNGLQGVSGLVEYPREFYL